MIIHKPKPYYTRVQYFTKTHTQTTKDGPWYCFELYYLDSKEIYCEFDNGEWYICEYDDAGNLTYYIDDDNYWEKREYDLDGNQIYYENADGNII